MPNQEDVLFASPDLTIVKVVEVRCLGGHRLWIKFSDGTSGKRDFSDVMAKTGPMVQPLQDAAFFGQVFVENGVLTWPNGYDVDSINLQMKMRANDELSNLAAE
jgi:hypothetical protein